MNRIAGADRHGLSRQASSSAAGPAGLVNVGLGSDGRASTLEIVPDAVLVTDSRGAITAANVRAANMFGATVGDLIGQPVEALVPRDRRHQHEALRERYRERPSPRPTHGVTNLEAMRLDDGRRFPVDVALAPVTVDGEMFTVATIRDLSVTQAHDFALQPDPNRMEFLCGISADLVMRVDPDLRTTWVSLSTERVLGLPPRDVLGRPMADLVARADHEALGHLVDEARHTRRGASARIRLTGTGHPHGRWVEIEIAPQLDTTATIVGYVVGARDVHAEVTAAQEAADRLAASERRYRLIAQNASGVVLRIGPGRVIAWASPSAAESFGKTEDEILGLPLEDLAMWEDRRALVSRVDQALRDRNPDEFLARFHNSPDDWRWMSVHIGTPTGTEPGDQSPEFAAIGLRDVHEQVLAQDALAQSERMFRLAMAGAPQGMAVVGLHLNVMEHNEALCVLLGRSSQWISEHMLSDLIHPDEREADLRSRDEMLAGRADHATRERRLVASDAADVWVLHSTGLLRDKTGMPLYYVEQFQDITENRSNRQILADQAEHDALTGLHNRRHLLSTMATWFGRESGTELSHAVLFCDVDHFAGVNNRLGHAVGDQVLAAVGARIRAGIRDHDLAARMGGDEFVVVLQGVGDIRVARGVADELRRAVAQPMREPGDAPGVTMSVGVAVSKADVHHEVALRRADAALYEAKHAGRNRTRVAVLDNVESGHAVSDENADPAD